MRVSVFGIGYVGTVVAGCMAQDGHEIVAVDISADKVRAINAGETPISEPGVPALIERAVARGTLSATTDAGAAVLATELSFVCVGTPSRLNGDLDLSFVLQVCEDIATSLKHKTAPHMLAVRSTVLPGVMRDRVIPILREASGKANRRVRLLETRGQAGDHPILLSMPETEYLHFALLEVM